MNNIVIHPTIASDWPVLKATRHAALLDAPTAFGASHASAAGFSDADWQQRAVSTPQRTFFLAFDGDKSIGLAAQVLANDDDCHLIAMWVQQQYQGMAVAPGNARAAAFYQKQGFVFLPEWEALESHPHIRVQKMEWRPAA